MSTNDRDRNDMIDAALRKAGFEAGSTGGGCEGWLKALPADGQLLITAGDANLYDEPEARTWYVGESTSELQEARCVLDVTLSEALKVAAHWSDFPLGSLLASSLEALTIEYQSWAEQRHLPKIDPEVLLVQLTERVAYLKEFLQRWTSAEEAERGRAEGKHKRLIEAIKVARARSAHHGNEWWSAELADAAEATLSEEERRKLRVDDARSAALHVLRTL